MEKTDVDNIIADVFRLSGQKLTADDPIVAVLLMQEHGIQRAFQEQQVEHSQVTAEFMVELAQREKSILQAAEELKKYREQILADLLAKTNEQLTESEGRLYSSIQKKISVQTEAHINEMMNKLNLTLVVSVIALLIIMIVLKFI
ncbi:MAG: hypothetical protein Q4E16_01745 [Neisseria sp.]|nr:hypothetical protein [Neisseria sp.]